MSDVLPPEVALPAAHDAVGRYDQDQINGFTPEFLDRFAEVVDPAGCGTLLDAMAGDGNFTRLLERHCRVRNLRFPEVTVLEFSRVQVEFARAELARIPARIIWGDVLSMRDLETGALMPEGAFDRVVIKSGTHEIPLDRQLQLYRSVYRALRPGGRFVNLGFVFDDRRERDEFSEITRVKDRLIGMHAAVANRHFLTREEFYSRLEQAGFVDARPAFSFDYRIHSAVVERQYFSRPGLESANAELQASQARSLALRRNNRIRFDGEHSWMAGPGEVTVARRPSWEESNSRAFRHCPYDFLRHLECHASLLSDAVRHIAEGAAVVDLGCGPGLLAERLRARAGSYRGIEISPEFVGSCRERHAGSPSLRFEQGDIMTADFGKDCADVVTLLNVLYLPGLDPVRILRKALDCLKPGGRLVVSGPTSPQSYRLAEPGMREQLRRDGLLERYEPQFRAVGEANDRLLPGQGNYWSLEGMVALLKELGFRRTIAQSHIYYGFGFMVVAEK